MAQPWHHSTGTFLFHHFPKFARFWSHFPVVFDRPGRESNEKLTGHHSLLGQTIHAHLHTSQIAPALAHVRRLLLPRNTLPTGGSNSSSGSNRDETAPNTTAPTPSQQARLKQRAATAVLRTLPRSVRSAIFGGTTAVAAKGSQTDLPAAEADPTVRATGVEAVPGGRDAADDEGQDDESMDDPNDPIDDAQRADVEHTLLEPLSDPYLNKHVAIALVELILVRILPEIGEQGVGELMGERLG
jgi:hypothetical protein